jgi:flagellar hook-basal body complex protein FliE
MIGTVSQARDAYARTLHPSGSAPPDEAGAAITADFGTVLGNAVKDAVATGHSAETLATQGLNGGGDMTRIVTAVSNAELALQTATVLRDKFVQAYQSVMSMTI